MSVRIIQGEALDVLRTLDAESVQCVVTSPPPSCTVHHIMV
ncbi:MAG: hypothetical protein WC977_12235 [Anaerovoracaceae bacterium]